MTLPTGSTNLAEPHRTARPSATVRLLLVVTAMPFAGRYVGGSFVRLGVIASAVAFVVCMPKLRRRDFVVAAAFAPFLVWAGISLCVAYPAARGKGAAQLAQIVCVLAGSTAVHYFVRTHGITLALRYLAIGCVGMALTALFQWSSLLLGVDWGNFAWLNGIAGGQYWRAHEFYGPLPRLNGFASEPAFLAASVQIASCICLAYLLHGGKTKSRTIKFTGLALIAELLALSLLGYFLLAVATLVLLAVLRPVRRSAVMGLVGLVAVMIIGLPLLGGDLSAKLGSVDAAFGAATLNSADLADSSHVSAVALGANLDVTHAVLQESPLIGHGLGSHPISYQRFAPPYLAFTPARDLNVDDAGSLALRLLSETGIIGAALFIAAWCYLLARAWRAVRALRSNALAAASLAAAASLGAYSYVRLGVYFDLPFWVPLAVASATAVPASERVRSASRSDHGS